MDKQEKAQKILGILENEFGTPKHGGIIREPFPTLIRTVLSQATNNRNRDRAYAELSREYAITPRSLAGADIKKIEKAIRVGGLFRNKSRKIKELSKAVLERLNGSLDFIYTQPLEKARATLMTIPGVGPKTADVVLLFAAQKPVVPVDTHVNRVSRRLELAPLKGNYEEIRKSIETLYSPKNYLPIHLLLISLGRKYCKARNPRHKTCPVGALCSIPKMEEKQPDLHRFHGRRDYP